MLVTFIIFMALLVLILLYVYRARLLEGVTGVPMGEGHRSPNRPDLAAAAAGSSKYAAFEYLTTQKDELVGWARKFSLFPYPFVTACCAMEFMSVSSSPTTPIASAPHCRASRRARPTC